MKKSGLIRNFLLVMLLMGVSIVVLWIIFYALTIEITRRNTVLAAESGAESMIESVEKELLRIEELAYNLSQYDRIGEMLEADDTISFYDLGYVTADRGKIFISNADMADNVVVFNDDGLFYRLKGTVSNTALKKAFQMMDQRPGGIVTVTYNRNTYIGSFKKIISPNGSVGYVVLFMDGLYIEKLLNAYDDIDYLGAVLLYDGKIVASTGETSLADLERIKEEAVFYKENEIGLTGFKLFIYCDDRVYKQVSVLYTLAMPAALVLLIAVVLLFIRYLTRHMLKPIDSIITGTKEGGAKPLVYTGEQDFDGLVDHINEMVERIEEREKELYASEMKYREAELEKERTLLNLLKKQISAHFTVNTLNAVRALINKGESGTAAGICDALSTLLRYANAADEYISLMDEFYVLEQYTDIMKIRYPGKIEAVFEEDDSFEDIMIPRMLVQPVLENAILHGLDGRQGKITVTATVSGNEVNVIVKDNGKGMTARQLQKVRAEIDEPKLAETSDLTHIALNNIQKRIKIVCGEEYGISIESKEGDGTEVKLTFPFIDHSGNI